MDKKNCRIVSREYKRPSERIPTRGVNVFEANVGKLYPQLKTISGLRNGPHHNNTLEEKKAIPTNSLQLMKFSIAICLTVVSVMDGCGQLPQGQDISTVPANVLRHSFGVDQNCIKNLRTLVMLVSKDKGHDFIAIRLANCGKKSLSRDAGELINLTAAAVDRIAAKHLKILPSVLMKYCLDFHTLSVRVRSFTWKTSRTVVLHEMETFTTLVIITQSTCRQLATNFSHESFQIGLAED
ncbi:hypothetical protein DICVIV_13424 [Dictyocaulus viviparus]|uniref:Uncharacterized protein n=1 Tax=Dictyocaulus viviparus TaxID=29172 RepID=A0A0D8XA27_DICVI|nr:hypothetical protein DICVIV_13424 [Dictyocaulus viviparus]